MNLLRQIVSGKKNRMKEAGYNLDLTYVCPRVIGMSFPAEGFEVTFRNNINDVVSFIKERHGNDFRIYNLSGRPYDIKKFDNQVEDFAWEDHHSPPIHILFKLCKNIDQFLACIQSYSDFTLEKISNVISIHCLAGKGRTGTAICCYLLYCGRFDNSENVLLYYAKKRFQKGGGVTQPSQRRYVAYFESLLNKWNITPVLKYITSVTLNGIPAFQKNKSCRPFIEIYNVKEDKLILIYTDKTDKYKQQRKYTDMDYAELNTIKVQILTPFVVLGDVMIKVYQHGRFSTEPMFRFAFNTAFLTEDNVMKFEKNQLDPDKVDRDERFPDGFYAEVKFTDYCKCTNVIPFDQKCKDCSIFMQQVRPSWNEIYSIMKDYEKHSIEESKVMLFGDPDFDDLNEILYTKCIIRKINKILEMPIIEAQDQEQNDFDQDEEQIQQIPKEKEKENKKKQGQEPLMMKKKDSFFKTSI